MQSRNYKKQSFSSSLLSECYDKYSHSCGLDIYVFQKKMSTKYALLGTKYGSINNSFRTSDGETVTVPDGIAHFLEHKLFFNEDGSDSFERFSEYGADANAYTSFNKTVYLFSCADNFDRSLTELIQFVTHPYFTPESVATEVGIISEEIKMYDDSPADRCFYGMLEGMYEKHSIRRNICGSVESISQITDELLYKCYHAFYRPDNMALVVCGDVNADEVLNIVDRCLEDTFCTKDKVVCIDENQCESPEAYSHYVEMCMQVSKPMFCIGFKDTDISQDPKDRQKKDATMSILDEMLFSRAGELYNQLFDKKLIAPAVSYGYTICDGFAYNSLSGESDEPKVVLDEVMRFINDTRQKGLDKNDFERAKKVMYAESIKAFDSVEGIANSLFSFICEGADMLEYTDIIGSVTFEDVKNAFEHSFDDSTLTLSVVNPIEQ